MGDKDRICGGGNHHRGCESTEYTICCPWAMFTHKPISITAEQSVPQQVASTTYCTLIDYSSEMTTGGSHSWYPKTHTEDSEEALLVDVVEDRRWLASCHPCYSCNPYQALMVTYNPGGAEALKFVALRTPYLVESHAKLVYSKPSRAPTLQAARVTVLICFFKGLESECTFPK